MSAQSGVGAVAACKCSVTSCAHVLYDVHRYRYDTEQHRVLRVFKQFAPDERNRIKARNFQMLAYECGCLLTERTVRCPASRGSSYWPRRGLAHSLRHVLCWRLAGKGGVSDVRSGDSEARQREPCGPGG